MTRALALALAACAAGCAGEPTGPRAHERRLIVLGVDGMDPVLLEQYIREGRMPNLAALAERNGGVRRLGTSNPPQSPVAWSNFMTGAESGVHGIYDFVHRDADRLEPYLSTSRADDGDAITIGSFAVPTSPASIHLLREGTPFWDELVAHGVPVTVVKIPANFPAEGGHGAEVLAGMGTPDLLGTPGTFHVYTDDPALAERSPAGGAVHALSFDGQSARATLPGPPDAWSADGDPIEMSVEVTVDKKRPVALVELGGARVMLEPGEWSHWVPIAFDPGMLGGDIAGMVRLYLKSLRPHVTIYTSPINLDPIAPVMPLSTPASYAADLARDAGRYYTQGMPEDTKALAAGVLSDDEFLAQADLVFEERLRLLDRELDRFDGGVLFFYFSSIDQVCHVFWRTIEPDASPADAAHARVIPDLYARVDAAIGEVLDRAGGDTDVLVMSDHGFAPYRRKVHLNTWLAQRGYLALHEPDDIQSGSLGHIDWSRTQAYALGLNQLFINLEGRERRGVVPAAERQILVDRLSRELERWRDPDTGARVVTRAYAVEAAQFPTRAPDLLVGYNRGYRSSDQSAIGQLSEQVLVDNHDKWSGDHCMDPSHVPGVLLSTAPLTTRGGSLTDMAPTILGYFGVEPTEAMAGQSLLSKEVQTP